MGRNNRARRAAKAKTRARSRSSRHEHTSTHGRQGHDPGAHSGPHSHTGADGPPVDAEYLADLLVGGAQRVATGVEPADMARHIVVTASPVGSAADDGVTLAADRLLDRAWRLGWQPAEVARQVRLRCDRATQRALRRAITANHVSRPGDTLDVRWRAQLDDLGIRSITADRRWWSAWAHTEQLDRTEALGVTLRMLAEVGSLPDVEVLIPPPADLGVRPSPGPDASWSGHGPGADSATADPVLERIRALLAKAESTTFEAEATALTAKAQELMTRHAIDSARLHTAESTTDGRPITTRVPIDPPYVDAKSLLLQHVASATRCRSVMLTGLSMSSVIGYPDDVRAVELLFTSLLVQAQSALAEAARHAPPGTRVRGQGFRSAFLLSYATRIGARLAEINQSVVDAEAAEDAGFLPVLRSRAAAVEEAVEAQYGDLSTSRARGGHDALGWAQGRRAADEARLNAGDLDHGGRP
ncbi:MAG: DUF2786 domain-containing protein [Acidimicrobiia bacterium]|nr:DUF2786 domain-containing protein [Acidimicrobiia bacterium]